MSSSQHSISHHWQYYADLSSETHNGRVDNRGLGREEQLNETLEAIKRGEELNEAIKSRLGRMPHNRGKKHYHIRQYLIQNKSLATYEESPLKRLILAEELALVRNALTPEQWAIENRLADGESYESIASDHRVTSATMKVRVHRWREKLRANKTPHSYRT
ncbi:MAG TPA: hypothetical protein VG122_15485 [Gemmata sp.]|jgi:DNA-binding NarL/FixJ family response regulator|nr:hypothetical protein [Gemmata sp.]